MTGDALRVALALLDAASDGLVAAGPDGATLVWSRGAERLLGYSRDEALGRPLADLLADAPGRAAARHALGAAPGAAGLEARRKDGTAVPLEIRLARVETERGPVTIGALRARRDPSPVDAPAERPERGVGAAPPERGRAERLAVLGELVGEVAHKLRNPLGVIRNAAYYLRMTLPPDGTSGRHLEIIEREVAAADRLITGLLDFARLPAPARAPVDLGAVARDALERTAAPPGVRVVLELAPDLPALRVDRDQVRLVLDALVANAADAMPDGGTLTVRTAAANRAAVLSVADTGAGIAPEHLGRLFEPLFTTKPRAAGLGLTVARALAEANGARLAVASVPGGGSRFDVVFPAPDETEGRWPS